LNRRPFDAERRKEAEERREKCEKPRETCAFFSASLRVSASRFALVKQPLSHILCISAKRVAKEMAFEKGKRVTRQPFDPIL
jgi:hypothetical protein